METQLGSATLRVVTWVSTHVVLSSPSIPVHTSYRIQSFQHYSVQNINGLRSLLEYAREGLAALFKRLNADIGEFCPVFPCCSRDAQSLTYSLTLRSVRQCASKRRSFRLRTG